VIEYPIFLRGLAQQWERDRNEIWHKGSLGMRTMPNMEYMHSAEKARDTTLGDEKYNRGNIGAACIDRTSVSPLF